MRPTEAQKRNEAQKQILKVLHSWGDCEVRTDRDSMSAESLCILIRLQAQEYLNCRWGSRVAFCLTELGREAAKELEEQ